VTVPVPVTERSFNFLIQVLYVIRPNYFIKSEKYKTATHKKWAMARDSSVTPFPRLAKASYMRYRFFALRVPLSKGQHAR
jgi:hypothetical protein